MKNFVYITLLCLLASCERIENIDGHLIGLKADVGELVSDTKVAAVPYEGTSPTADSRLSAAVWFSLSPSKFQHNPEAPSNLPCRTTMTFESTATTYASYLPDGKTESVSLRYPTADNTPVYCIGLYPDTGWTTTDGIQVSHPINGEDDLMFADVIQGTWDNHFENQEYNHLLTWIKVSVCAMTLETATQWGNVTNITVSSKSKVNIDLSQANKKISYDGETQALTTYDDQTGISLSLTSQEAGSVFCSPATEYEVRITTENYGEKTLTVKLSDLDYNDLTNADQAVGKLFILSLYFNPFNVIEGTCTLNYWNDQNEDLYLN